MATFNEIIAYIKAYQRELGELRAAAADAESIATPTAAFAALGPVVVYPCRDGAVALTKIAPAENGEVTERPNTGLTIEQFLNRSPATDYFDERGQRTDLRLGIRAMQDWGIVDMTGLEIRSTRGKLFRPQYDRLTIFGWTASLTPSPTVAAGRDFERVFMVRNLAGTNALALSRDQSASAVRHKKKELLAEFRSLLESAEYEQELQTFLAEHPELLYPEYVEVKPQFPLGTERRPDFVIIAPGYGGLEHVFVEIERADKPLYTKDGHFSHEFTQARNQLLDWENWITTDRDYLARRLPGLQRPVYHLVMGRSGALTEDQLNKLSNAMGRKHERFSTFDHIAEKFEATVNRILDD